MAAENWQREGPLQRQWEIAYSGNGHRVLDEWIEYELKYALVCQFTVLHCCIAGREIYLASA